MSDYQHLLFPRAARVLQQATFLRRMGAFLLDLLLIDFLIAAPFSPIFQRMSHKIEAGLPLSYTNAELGAAMLLLLIMYCYFVLFEYLLGQSPGMMLLNLQIDGNVGIGAILLRNSFLVPVFPFVLFWIIEPVAILLWRRGILEYLSGTRTVHLRQVLL